MPVLSTVEAQLSLHKSAMLRKQPQKHGNGKKPVANYEQGQKLRWCYTVLCVLYASSMIQ